MLAVLRQPPRPLGQRQLLQHLRCWRRLLARRPGAGHMHVLLLLYPALVVIVNALLLLQTLQPLLELLTVLQLQLRQPRRLFPVGTAAPVERRLGIRAAGPGGARGLRGGSRRIREPLCHRSCRGAHVLELESMGA